MMESDLKIILPDTFTIEQERLILKYLELGRRVSGIGLEYAS